MRVFMLGWEFPPYITGGLGTACYGLTKALDDMGVQICFVLPTAIPVDTSSHVQFRSPSNLPAGQTPSPAAEEGQPPADLPQDEFKHVELHRVDAVLQPYGTPESFEEAMAQLAATQEPASAADKPAGAKGRARRGSRREMPSGTFIPGSGLHYAGDLMAQVRRYAHLVVKLAREESFDVVHAHDWMTFPGAMAVAAALGRPLVIHIHSTEFDRAGENVNKQIYEIERKAMHAADREVCVSFLTKSVISARYGVPADRIEVVYNAVDTPKSDQLQMRPITTDEKIVLFLGRLTMQKGPEYFLRAAKKVAEKCENVRFVVAGSGDMIAQCMREVTELGLGKHVTFTGFLRGEDVAKVFSMADLYVMPSVSEPFGIAPLEALSHNVPVIISRQSGVSEVLTHVLKVDFWDVDEMANKILAVLTHPPLQRTLRQHGHIELRKLSWRESAMKLREVYQAVVAGEN